MAVSMIKEAPRDPGDFAGRWCFGSMDLNWLWCVVPRNLNRGLGFSFFSALRVSFPAGVEKASCTGWKKNPAQG